VCETSAVTAALSDTNAATFMPSPAHVILGQFGFCAWLNNIYSCWVALIMIVGFVLKIFLHVPQCVHFLFFALNAWLN